MVVLASLPEIMQNNLAGLDCPSFETEPWVRGGPLKDRRIAVLSSAGIHRRDDKHFVGGDAGYRVIPQETTHGDLTMSHVSVNYDRTAFQQDLDSILPLQHLKDMAEEGVIGSVASNHYSFMGATDPRTMEENARQLAGELKADNVDTVVLIPV